MSSPIPLFLLPRDSVSKPLPASILVPIILLVLLGVLSPAIIICIVCCACGRSHRQKENMQASKRAFRRAKLRDPGLTYKEWTTRQMARGGAVGGDGAAGGLGRVAENRNKNADSGLDYPMMVEGQRLGNEQLREDVGVRVRHLRGFLGSYWALRKDEKAKVRARARAGTGVDDEEVLVGGEVGAVEVKSPARTAAWGQETLPAYTSIAVEDT